MKALEVGMSETDVLLRQIDIEELADLALDLGNIDSPPGREKPVAEFVPACIPSSLFITSV